MSQKGNFQMLSDLVDSMDEQILVYRELLDDTITGIYGLSLEIKKYLRDLTDEDIDEFNDESISAYFLNDNGEEIDMTESKESSDTPDATDLEYKKGVLKHLRKQAAELIGFETQAEEFRKQREDLAKGYMDYFNSPQYKERRANQLAEMRKKLEVEEDPSKKRVLANNIATIEALSSYSFLFSRFDSVEAEKASLIRAFFQDSANSYIMSRFETKCRQLEINPQFYMACVNLEEKFLDDEYHPFNNLFLFIVIKFIAYVDRYKKEDRLFVSTIMFSLNKLVYHQFTNDEDEKEFLDVIRSFDGRFMDMVEEFKEKNTTYPKHPERIQKDIIRQEMIEKLKIERRTVMARQFLGICDTCPVGRCLDAPLLVELRAKDADPENVDEKVIIDFTDIQTMSDNCADSVFGVLAEEKGSQEIVDRFEFTNIEPDIWKVISSKIFQ